MILQAWLTLPSCLASSSSPSFGSDDLLFLGHFVVSVPCAGGRVAVPARGENRAPPPAPLRKPTTIVRLSSSYYNSAKAAVRARRPPIERHKLLAGEKTEIGGGDPRPRAETV